MTQKKHHPLRALVCLILSLILFIIVICNGLISDLRGSVLKGKDIDDILSNTRTYAVVEDILIETIAQSTKDYGVSRDAIEDIITDGLVETTASKVLDAIMSGKPMDFTYLDESVEKSVILITDTGVKNTMKDFDEKASTLTVADIAESKSVKEIEKEYNVSISSQLSESLSKYTENNKFKVSDEKKAEVENDVYNALYNNIYPAVTKVINEYKDECNDMVNDAIKDADSQYSFSSMLRKVDDSLKLTDYAIIGIWVLCLILFGLQILIYNKDKHKAFKNLAVIAIFTTLFKIACICALAFSHTQILSSIKKEKDPYTDIFADYITYNMDLIKKCMTVSAIVFIVIAIGSIIFSVKLKKKHLTENTSEV